jgi:hypothetical protein
VSCGRAVRDRRSGQGWKTLGSRKQQELFLASFTEPSQCGFTQGSPVAEDVNDGEFGSQKNLRFGWNCGFDVAEDRQFTRLLDWQVDPPLIFLTKDWPSNRL